MVADHESRRLRARQVGMLLWAYRSSHSARGSRRGLSQDGLLDLMGRVDPGYLDRYDRSTVSRWESGATYPTVERLRVFGRALDLSSTEIDGLILLAGLEGDDASNRKLPEDPAGEAAAPGERTIPAGAGDGRSYFHYLLWYCLSRFILPGGAVTLAGYAIASIGWNSPPALTAYFIVAVCFVAGREFLRLRRSNSLRDLMFVTVFVLMSVPLLATPLNRLDPYGFYAIGNLAGTTMQFALNLVANLLIALIAGLMFDCLWRWQYSSRQGARSVYGRAVWTAFPPQCFVFIFLLAFSDMGAWISGLGTSLVLSGVLVALLVLRDDGMRIDKWDRRFLLWRPS